MMKSEAECRRGCLLAQYPFELIAAILAQAAQVDHNNAAGVPRFIASPLVLRQVCRSWQVFVDSTPSLWQALVIMFPQMEVDIAGVKEWTNRAGNLPIDLYIDGSNLRQTLESFNKIEAMADVLAVLSPRWKLLELRNVKKFFVNLIQSRLRGAFGKGVTLFPILDSIAIHFSQDESSHPTVPDFRSLAKLKSLDIRGQEHNLSSGLIPQTQAAQLTCFRLERTAFDFKALRSFMNLTNLYFRPFDGPPTRPFESMPIVLLEHLQSLTFIAQSWNLAFSRLQRLFLPKLTNLSIALHPILEVDSLGHTISIPEVQPRFEEELLSILSSYPEVTQLHLVVKTEGLRIGRTCFENLGFRNKLVELSKLQIFSYEGNLQLDSITFLMPILARCTSYSDSTDTAQSSLSEAPSSNITLRFVKIKSNDLRPLFLPDNLSHDSETHTRLKKMVARSVLWLIDNDEKALI